MIGFVGILALLTVFALSMLVTRVATIALAATGLSQDAARFQARSAFTGTGFTSRETEKVVNHPLRRRIINLLMLLRSAGIVSILISLILSFAGDNTQTEILTRLTILVSGFLGLWLLVHVPVIDRLLGRGIQSLLRRFSDLDTRDYGSLLRLSGDYRVLELQVQEGDWIEGKTLKDCQLNEEGVRVLGVYRREGEYLGAPKGAAQLHRGDTVVLYGHSDRLVELDERRADAVGQSAHEKAVRDHREEEEKEARRDEEATRRQSQKDEAGRQGEG